MIPQSEPLIGQAEKQALAEYMESGGYLTEYKKTEEFEKMLAEFLGVKYVSLVPNGTIALYLALLASGVGEGDEVIVPDLTMIATANAVTMTGAVPELTDIEPEKWCMDMSKVSFGGRTKALIYVDFNGRSGDMEAVQRFCDKKGLVLIEDACQALGSQHNGKYLGTFGRFGCFSLGFHKIITTGQGGFVVTHSDKDHEIIERLKDFGRLKGGNDIHTHMGFNFKFTDLQAVVGIEQLKTIEKRIAKKKQIYEWYWHEKPDYTPWFIEAIAPQLIADYLAKQGIGTRPIYPPIHTQPIYPDGDYPVAEAISRNGLWLPSSLTLEEKDVRFIRRFV